SDQALRYGVDLNEPFVLIAIELVGERGSSRLMELYRRINRLSADWRVIVGQFAGEVLVLARATGDLEALTTAIHTQAEAIRLGVSGVQHGVGGVAAAHSQCRDALRITRRLGDPRETVFFDQLGYL